MRHLALLLICIPYSAIADQNTERLALERAINLVLPTNTVEISRTDITTFEKARLTGCTLEFTISVYIPMIDEISFSRATLNVFDTSIERNENGDAIKYFQERRGGVTGAISLVVDPPNATFVTQKHRLDFDSLITEPIPSAWSGPRREGGKPILGTRGQADPQAFMSLVTLFETYKATYCTD